jgi:aminoglycoside phosphotransferase family enzyme/predicted kinase
MADDQRGVVAFLSDPASYGAEAAAIERLETHISQVFLVGDRAYKLKRAVALPYVDFSTVERRRQACDAELALNRRTAPQLYLEVRAISRRADGRLDWGSDGEVIDWVVVMRRFDQRCRLDAVARCEGLSPALLHSLAAHIAEFHREAEHCADRGGAAALAATVRENDECLRASRGGVFAAAAIEMLRSRSEAWLERVGPLLDRRRAAGNVRRCHGDLHLRNICVLNGKPVLFDCIEFSDEFASIDVLYDLAFLLMDLAHQGQSAAANRVLNRYLDLAGQDDGLAAMPLFLSLRAAIRAHVTATAGAPPAESRGYLDEACAALAAPPARLIAIGGLSGTGKSTLAAGLAPGLGAGPGARVLRSDVIRKRLFGADPEAPLPEHAYAAETTAHVYAVLRSKAATAIAAGYCAIIDAVALHPEERESFATVAHDAAVPFTGIWLDAPLAALSARVAARRGDASDATPEIVDRQSRADPGPLDWTRVDASRSPADTLAVLRAALA